jgi:hypothetical protein
LLLIKANILTISFSYQSAYFSFYAQALALQKPLPDFRLLYHPSQSHAFCSLLQALSDYGSFPNHDRAPTQITPYLTFSSLSFRMLGQQALNSTFCQIYPLMLLTFKPSSKISSAIYVHVYAAHFFHLLLSTSDLLLCQLCLSKKEFKLTSYLMA